MFTTIIDKLLCNNIHKFFIYPVLCNFHLRHLLLPTKQKQTKNLTKRKRLVTPVPFHQRTPTPQSS